jgi:adenylosuccinate lyase
VERGGDRQVAHEIIRKHSIEAARELKDGATTNDLIARLASDPELGLSAEILAVASDPSRYTGRAAQQVDEFLAEVVEPLLAGASAAPPEEEIRV